MTLPKLPDSSETLEYPWDEVTTALLRARSIHDGLWQPGVRFQFAAVTAGLTPDSVLPTSLASVETVTLTRVRQPGKLVFDAAQLNPRPVAATKTGKAKKPEKPKA